MAESKPTLHVSSTGIASVRPSEILRSDVGKRIIERTAEVLKEVRQQKPAKPQA